MKKLVLIFSLFLSFSTLMIAQNNSVGEKLNTVLPRDLAGKQSSVIISYDPQTGKFYAVQTDTTGKLKVVGTLALDQATIDSLQNASTSNGSKEATQLLVLAEMQNRVNLGGLQTYSSKRGDFTVTPRAAGKSVTITGANFTVSAGSVVYASKRTTGGIFSVIPTTTVTDSIAGTSIRFDAMTGTFSATDVVDIMFIQPEKTIDKANDAIKGIEQSPLWARYQIDEIYDGTNVAAATNYYPSATGASMDGYKNLSFTGKLIDADNTTTVTIEATNDEDATNADWIQVYGYDSKGNAIVNSVAAASTTTTFAWDFDDFNYQYFRVKVVTGDATNTIIIKQRRTF